MFHVSPSSRPMQIKTAALVKHRTTCLLNVFPRPPRQIDSPPPSSTAYCTMPDTRCQAEPLRILASRMLFRGIVCRGPTSPAGTGSRPSGGTHAIVKACSAAVALKGAIRANSGGRTSEHLSLECFYECFSFNDPNNSYCGTPRGTGRHACARGPPNRWHRPVGRRCTEGASRLREAGTGRRQT